MGHILDSFKSFSNAGVNQSRAADASVYGHGMTFGLRSIGDMERVMNASCGVHMGTLTIYSQNMYS